MPVYKNDKNGTWYAMVRYKDWTGQNKQKCQRGFATRREALEWEAQFKLQKTADIDMTLTSFCELYEMDVKSKLKLNTWLTVNTFENYILRIDCNKAEDGLKTTPFSQNSLNELAIDESLEYARLDVIK